MQQLNAVTISGVPARSLDGALKFSRRSAQDSTDRLRLDYTGESRQLRVEGDKFVPAFILAIVLIFLSCRAVQQFSRPFIILLGSVPLALFGASFSCF